MKVIEKILPKREFYTAERYFLSQKFPWCYGRQATHATNVFDNPFLCGWFNLAYDTGMWKYDPNRYIEPLVYKLLKLAGEEVQELLRVRLIMNTIADKPYKTGTHVDFDTQHKVALFYLNYSDGDTILYNEKYDISSDQTLTPEAYLDQVIKEPTVMAEVEPEANKLLVFDGLHYHSGTIPIKKDRRVAININYISA